MDASYLSKNKVPCDIKLIQCKNHKKEQSYSFSSMLTVSTHGHMGETEKTVVQSTGPNVEWDDY